MRRRRTAALVWALLLALFMPALAEEEGFGTYIQPEGVTVCPQQDLRYFDAPAGLEALHALMSGPDGNAKDVYLFLMPHGTGMVSVARQTAVCDARGLSEAWPKILEALGRESGVVQVGDAELAEERAFGFDAVRVRAPLTLTGDVPVQAEGLVLFREADTLEVWTVCAEAAFCGGIGISDADVEADQAAMKQLTASFDFGGDEGNATAAREAVLVEDAIPYLDPGGAFSLMIPGKALILTPDTDAATAADYRVRFAGENKDDGKVFDQWLTDVTEDKCTLMLLPELGLAWQVFCEDEESFRKATLSTYYLLAEPVRAGLEEHFGSAQTLSDDGSAVISGLKHAKLVYWLRTGQTDVALEVYAITDKDGLLRELDLYTMMDRKADGDRQKGVLQMLQDTLSYTTPTGMPAQPAGE